MPINDGSLNCSLGHNPSGASYRLCVFVFVFFFTVSVAEQYHADHIDVFVVVMQMWIKQ